MRVWFVAAAVLTFASCGKINDARDALSFKELGEANFAVREQFKDMPGTRYSAMPTGGSATFDGAARVFIDPDLTATSDNILLYGDATIAANFRTRKVTGSIDNMRGASGISENGADIFDVTGRIAIGNGGSDIGSDTQTGTSRPNDWAADYTGTLEIPQGSYTLGGLLVGQFVGTEPGAAIPMRGIYGEDNDGIATRNGRDMPVSVQIGAARN